MKKEQDYWSVRKEKEWIEKLMDRQLSLFEEIDDQIITTELLAKDLKIETARYVSLYKLSVISKKEIKELNSIALYAKVVEYHKNLYKLSAKFQLIPLYFSKKVSRIIEPLTKSLQENYNNNLLFADSSIALKDVLTGDIFNRDYGTISALTSNRLNLLKSMQNEIELSAKNLYKKQEN